MKPRRSVLSVPGHVEKMHLKANLTVADNIMLDLEDSVPPDYKESARNTIINSLKNTDWKRKQLSVRINGLDTPFAYKDIIAVVESAGNILDTIVIPKVQNAGDVCFVSRLLDGIEMHMGFKNTIGIEASIETAEGLNQVESIARASNRLKTLVFGIADFSASIGARLVSISGHGEAESEIYPGHRWHYALSRMVVAGKANGLLVIDAPYGNYSDQPGLEDSARKASALGCDGKWAIHPSQIDTINIVFSPSTEEIERALRIVQAHTDAESSGLGAVALDGRMVDRATIRMARNLLDNARYLKLI